MHREPSIAPEIKQKNSFIKKQNMKKTLLTFGTISGLIMALMMFITLPLIDHIGFGKAEILGYTSMVLSFLMVFFGILSYREQYGMGAITFGKGFQVGLLITIISCLFYVAAWLIIYYKITPDFADKYGAYSISQLKAAGKSQEVIAAATKEMEAFKEMYKNPLVNAGITFLEPFPVGLVISLISAGVLKKKPVSA